jgi:hypothetical protein
LTDVDATNYKVLVIAVLATAEGEVCLTPAPDYASLLSEAVGVLRDDRDEHTRSLTGAGVDMAAFIRTTFGNKIGFWLHNQGCTLSFSPDADVLAVIQSVAKKLAQLSEVGECRLVVDQAVLDRITSL